MKFIRKALVMLCVFVLGYMIVNGKKNLAEEHIEKYKIEINGQIVTRVNERPDYDKYITIKDKEGNDVTNDVWYSISEGVLKLDKVGIYPIIVYAYDEEANSYVIIQTKVKVVEDNPPKIINHYEKHYFALDEISEEEILKGISVTDDFTEKPLVYIKDFANIDWQVGEYTVTIVAEDDNGLNSEEDITVVIVEELPPLILNEYLEVEVFHQVDLKELLVIDELYRDKINIEFENNGMFIKETLGEYKIKILGSFYNINSEIELKVVVVDKTKPYITGEKNISIKKGETFNYRKYFSIEDNYDDVKDLKVSVIGHYDKNKPGKYNLTLFVRDTSNNTSYYYFTLTVEKKSKTLLWVIIISGIVVLGAGGTYYLKKYRMII